jgi:hypothetical protein
MVKRKSKAKTVLVVMDEGVNAVGGLMIKMIAASRSATWTVLSECNVTRQLPLWHGHQR